MVCPQCGSDNVYETKRRGLEKMIGVFSSKKPFQCKECWARFMKSDAEKNKSNKKSSRLYIIIFLLMMIPLLWYKFVRKSEPDIQVAHKPPAKAVQTPPKPIKPESKPVPQAPSQQPVKPDAVSAPPVAGQPVKPDAVSAPPSGSNQPSKPPMADTALSPPVSAVQPVKPDAVSAPPSGSDQPSKPPIADAVPSQPVAAGQPAKPDAPSAAADQPSKKDDTSTASLTIPPVGETKPVDPKSSGTGKELSAPAAPATPMAPITEMTAIPELPPKDSASESTTERSISKTSGLTGDKKPDAASKSVSEKDRLIKQIVTEQKGGEFIVSISADQPMTKFKRFYMHEPPPRLVLNIYGDWKYSGPNELDVKSDMINKIRIGSHEDFFSIVLDLNLKDPISPTIKKSENGLVLTVKKLL